MSSMFGGGFKSSKCKTLLRLAMARIKLLRNKRDIQVKQMRKDIAQLLQTGQEPSARIRVEHIAREQNVMAAYDIIELFCELLTVRLPIIEAQKTCPIDLKEAVSTLIFAAPRCADLPELIQIRTQFTIKYGKEFVAAAAELRPDCGVNRRIIEKLSVRAPPGEAKLKLLKEIAEEFKVEWDPADTEAELLKRPEDLLDGPKQFYGASSAPLPDAPPVYSSERESSSFSRRAPDVPVHPPSQPPPPPPSAPSAPAPIQMKPLYQSSDEDSSPEFKSGNKPQFVPFVGPHPSQRVQAESTTTPSRSNSTNMSSSSSGKYDSHKAASRSDYQARKESRMDYGKSGDYMNVDEAVQAAAEYSKRAAAAARAAAALRRSHSSSPSPPRSRRGGVRSHVDSDDEEDAELEHPPRPNYRRKPSTRSADEAVKNERDGGPKRSDSDKSRDGASFTRRNVEEERDFSFRISSQEDPRPRRTNSDDRDRGSFGRVSSTEERREGSYRGSKSEDSKESFGRSNSDDRPEVASSRNRGDVFSKNDNDKQGSSFWKMGSEKPPEYDVEPPRKVDPENESFWKPAYPDWRSGEDSEIAKKIDSGIFTGHEDEEEKDYQRKSSGSRRSDHGKYGEGPYSNVFSRADSAESYLFKRSDSAELDGRSSEEFYDSKQGFATPKFDDEDHSSSHRNSRLSTNYEEDLFKRDTGSSMKSSFNEFWRTDTQSQGVSEEEEAFVKKYSFGDREDMKPLEKAKSDSLFEKGSQVAASEGIDRADSDPIYSRSASGEESRLSKVESAASVRSRRTRVNRYKPEDVGSFGSPVRRSKTYTQADNPSDDSPFNLRPIPFNPAPSSNSSAYHSPDAPRDSSPSSNTSPGSVHPKLPDIDDLTARFEALKAAKR